MRGLATAYGSIKTILTRRKGRENTESSSLSNPSQTSKSLEDLDKQPVGLLTRPWR